jgi:hypothetical protein
LVLTEVAVDAIHPARHRGVGRRDLPRTTIEELASEQQVAGLGLE